MARFLVALWLAILVIATPAAAQTFPKLTGRVVDQANLLDPPQEAELTSKLAALETRSGRQLVVATVASLEGRTIEDYGYRLGREWGIGQADENDGVVLLVAPNERKVRIETGYGARVFLTDAVSSVIIRSITPKFKEGDFAGGINTGVDQIITWMELPEAEAARRAQELGAAEAKRGEEGFNPMPIVVAVAVFFLIFLSIARRASGRRYRGKGGRRRGGDGIDPMVILWGIEALSHIVDSDGDGGGFGGFGGGGGGGFGGFSGGGGSFGGGGASGGW